MTAQTFADFETHALARGFDEVLVREWDESVKRRLV